MKMKNIAIIVVSISALLLVCFEHGGREGEIEEIRPTYWMNRLYDFISPWFRWIGKVFARICNWIEYLRLYKLGITIADLLMTAFRLITSPILIIKGFIDQVRVYDHPIITYASGVALVTAIFFGVRKWIPKRWISKRHTRRVSIKDD